MIEHITEPLKEKIQSLESIPERIETLKDSYKGETCYIVSAGPSLKEYDPEFLKSRLKNSLVFTIKQSYLLLKEVCDFHILMHIGISKIQDIQDRLRELVKTLFE